MIAPGLVLSHHSAAALWRRRFVVDCLWRQPRLIVELDSRAAHTMAEQFEADREQDAILQASGWPVYRMTWARFDEQATRVAGELTSMLRGRRVTCM